MPVLKYRDPTTGEFVPVPQSIASVDGYATEAYVDAADAAVQADADAAQAAAAAAQTTADGKVSNTGDVMTGYLTVWNDSSSTDLKVDGDPYATLVLTSGTGRYLRFNDADGKNLFAIYSNSAGLYLARYDHSTGTWIESALKIDPDSGEITTAQDLTANDAVIGKIWSGTHIGIQQAPQGADGAGGPALLLGNTTNNGSTYLISRSGGSIVLRPSANSGGSYDSTFSTSQARIPTETSTKHVRWDNAKNYSGGDLNALRDNGFYDGSAMGNAPSSDWWHILHLEHSSNPSAWRRQIAWDFHADRSYTRRMANSSWTAWAPYGMQNNYGTVTPASGWTHYGSTYGNVTCYNDGRTVTVYGLMKTTGALSFGANSAIVFGTLPSSGWWPAQTLITAGAAASSVGSNIGCRVDISSTDGQLRGYFPSAGSFAAGQWFAVNANYPLK
jgi:hypothetical protein